MAYSDHEWQQIMTAVRRDVRISRDRIRAGVRLLARSQQGELIPGSREEALGRMLEEFASTGDLPRDESGVLRDEVSRLGGAMAISGMLSLTRDESTAFALLLSGLNAESFGTVKTWPDLHTRLDGGVLAQAVALVEETKPRRGPDREYMVAALEDLPTPLRELAESEDGESRLFHSLLRVYQLELTQTARRLRGASRAFVSYSPKRRSTFGRDFRNTPASAGKDSLAAGRVEAVPGTPPRARGCSGGRPWSGGPRSVFPADAGVFRSARIHLGTRRRSPRRRGGVPVCRWSWKSGHQFSPPSRGCSAPASAQTEDQWRPCRSAVCRAGTWSLSALRDRPPALSVASVA
ncbi:hypothetical protein LCE32_04810 [Streptomyces sp. 7G]|uniref:hypothetical protein n=1 Tax=Streptomyces sp. 7G TaxID=2877241 RepID=UPI001CD697B5|nr:hypothetical protein [Streptomyces sp. 7G]MCA1269392.1 hypothetical protein [Streptomyces sp. 7G]